MKKNEKLPSPTKTIAAAASNQSQRKRRRIPLRPNRTSSCLLPNDIRAVSAELKSIVLDRLDKEIISKFLPKANEDYGCGGVDDERGNEASKIRKEIGKRRVVLGVNQVTRSLERLLSLEKKKQQPPKDGKVVANGEGGKRDDDSSDHPKVRLIIMCKDSLAILGHIPVLAWSNMNIPFIMISGKSASEELGRIMGCKRVSVCLFLDRYEGGNKSDSVSGRKYDDEMDSSLNYIKEVCSK